MTLNDKKENNENVSYSIFNNVKWLIKLLWKLHKKMFMILILSIPVYVAIQFVGIYIPKLALTQLLSQNDLNTILFTMSKAIALVIILNITMTFIDGLLNAYRFEFGNDMVTDRYDKVLFTDYENLESPNVQTMYHRAQRILDSSGNKFGASNIVEGSADILKSILGYLVYGAVISFANPYLVIFLTVSPILNYFLIKAYNKYEQKNRSNWDIYERKMNYIAKESGSLTLAKDIRIYGMKGWLINMYKELYVKRLLWDKKMLIRNLPVYFVELLIILIRDGLAYYILIRMVLNNEIGLDSFVLYFAAISGFADWVGSIITQAGMINKTAYAVSDYRNFIELKENHNRTAKRTYLNDVEIPCEIKLENLSYKYQGCDEFALKNINLTIGKGEKIAIVGLNGAGKTTLVKTICGLYTPTEGQVLINNKPMSEYNIEDYYMLFSVVFQDVNFLPFRICELVANEGANVIDKIKVENCLKEAGLWEKVSSCPDGMDSFYNRQINNNGIDFSGGEKLKLSFAKALYKDAPILILDEPTSSLDPIAENKLYMSYAYFTENKTSIFISHRLASTRFCDRIMLLDEGKIIETGTHEELMKKKGRYFELFSMQSHYYKNKEADKNEN
jgi:ABC-type multidrug transport system fused ATPase/permease subunit